MAEKVNKTAKAALEQIQKTGRVTKEVADKLMPMGLIEVNTADIDENDHAAARLTEKGIEDMATKNNNVNTAGAGASTPSASKYQLITNAVLPESKRGFGRTAGQSKYPFADMQVGMSFFVGDNEVDGGDALKKLTSTVSNMNNKHRTNTGRTETKERTKRGEGNKAVVDADGNKVRETVTVPVYTQDRKFGIRAVKGGEKYGEWQAPSDGVLIARTL